MSIMSRRKIRNKKEFGIFIHKTNQHFYASLQNIDGITKYTYSTLSLRCENVKNSKAVNVNFLNGVCVEKVAEVFAESLKKMEVQNNVFYNRGRNKYCGLVALFADNLRKNGILI